MPSETATISAIESWRTTLRLRTSVDASIAQRLEPYLEPTLRKFYEKLQNDPRYRDALARGPGVEALKKAQAEHWRVLFDDGNADDAGKRARRVGAAHARAGLAPADFVHSYHFFYDAFTKVLMGPRWQDARNITRLGRAIFTDMEIALAAYAEAAAAAPQREINLQSLVQNVDQEVKKANKEAKTKAGELTSIVAELERSLDDLRKGVDLVESDSVASRGGIQSVAAAIEEMRASSREVGGQADETSRMAATAVQKAEQAVLRMQRLTQSASRVAEIVKLIADVSSQTNLLALNATIEAARAGDAGRGFAVVASEVKQLSQRTAAATKDIGEQIRGIEEATDLASAAMIEVSEIIDGMSKMTSGVAQHAASQIEALEEIGKSAHSAMGGANDLGASARLFTDGLAEVDSAATKVRAYGENVAGALNNLAVRLAATVNEAVAKSG